MPIEIGTTGEAGVLIAGTMIGLAMAVKIYKWIADMVDARLGQGKKYEAPEGTSMLSTAEHASICRGVKMEFADGFKALSEEIKELGRQRTEQVDKIYNEMKGNHTEVRNLFQSQGERIATLEAKVGKHG